MPTKKVESNTVVRPPVVAVMGHIDHGKSTLLDYIRKSNVAAGEAGGITQAVSAYEITEPHQITFIDTPGHAAFSGMRERSAALADIALLIISAEDGVKPQTEEALTAIRGSKIPFIVTINKIDRPAANIARAKQQLAECEVLVEGYGGTIPMVAISAKTGENVDELLEMIHLVAQLEDFKSEPQAPASGMVLETHLNPKTGIAATLIIKNGTLKVGDWMIADAQLAKVKRLNNFRGEAQTSLTASAPAQVVGWSDLPAVGSVFQTYHDKKAAEAAVEAARQKIQSPRGSTLGTLKVKPQTQNVEIPILIKAAVAGSLGAVESEITKLATDVVGFKIIDRGVGQITENDAKLASGAKGVIILGFNVKADKAAAELAEKLGITIVTDEIIYKLSEWLETEIARRTPVQETEQIIGRGKLLKIFGGKGNKQVVGGVVIEGRAADGKSFKILRRNTEIGRGRITELQQQKIRVKEVAQDSQFGASVEAKVSLAIGDVLELFDTVTK